MNRKKNLLQKFLEFNQQHRFTGSKKKTLLAVSGGVDSVVMCQLFHETGFPFAIAHANFQLRDKESDEDASFVKKLAEKYGVDFFSKKFDNLLIALAIFFCLANYFVMSILSAELLVLGFALANWEKIGSYFRK